MRLIDGNPIWKCNAGSQAYFEIKNSCFSSYYRRFIQECHKVKKVETHVFKGECMYTEPGCHPMSSLRY